MNLDKYTRKYKWLLGPNAGQIVYAPFIGICDTLQDRIDWEGLWGNKEAWEVVKNKPFYKKLDVLRAKNKDDGVWLLNMRLREGIDVENLHAPFDINNMEINVGDTIIYAKRTLEISKMKITKIEFKNHSNMMYGIDIPSNKKTRNSYPNRCWRE